MILPFSQRLNGRPTFFVEKIIKSLELELLPVWWWFRLYPFSHEVYKNCEPKLHTIRVDAKNRWHAGRKIHPVINNRTKKMFCLDDDLMICRSTQSIIIDPANESIMILTGPIHKKLADQTVTQLAINDGFATREEFFYHFNEPFTGKIIHWTDLKY